MGARLSAIGADSVGLSVIESVRKGLWDLLGFVDCVGLRRRAGWLASVMCRAIAVAVRGSANKEEDWE